MQVHFQFLSQALQKVQPVAQSCLAEALAQVQERCAGARSQAGALGELDEAARSWKGAAEVRRHLWFWRGRGHVHVSSLTKNVNFPADEWSGGRSKRDDANWPTFVVIPF